MLIPSLKIDSNLDKVTLLRLIYESSTIFNADVYGRILVAKFVKVKFIHQTANSLNNSLNNKTCS